MCVMQKKVLSGILKAAYLPFAVSAAFPAEPGTLSGNIWLAAFVVDFNPDLSTFSSMQNSP